MFDSGYEVAGIVGEEPWLAAKRWHRRAELKRFMIRSRRGMFCVVTKMFRPGYVNALVQDWLPTLDGVVTG